MFAFLSKWLAPPIFEDDEEKTRKASLLNVILLALFTAAALYGGFAPIEPALRMRRAVIIVPFLIVVSLLWWAMRRGSIRFAGEAVVWTLWAMFTLALGFGAGYNNPAFMGYVVVVVCAGLLLGRRATIIWAVIGIATSGLMLIAAERGFLPSSSNTLTGSTYWVAQGVYIFIISVLLSMALKSIERAVAKARQELSERIRAEEALTESVALYRQAIEAANAVPYSQGYDVKTQRFAHFTFMGEGIKKLTGYNPEELTQQLWDNLVQEVMPQGTNAGLSLDEAIQRSRTGETKIWQADYLIRTRDGETRWIADAAVEIKNEEGISTGSIGILQDITERKRLERELQEERDFVLQIINTMGQGLTVTDEDGHFILVNPVAAHLLGYVPDDVIGKQNSDVIFPEDMEVLAEARANRKRGEITTYEIRLQHKDKGAVQVLVTGAPRWKDGYYAGSIAIVTDLSQMKRAEQALRESEARLRQAQHVARLGIWDWEIATDQTTWWGEMFNIYGISPDEFTGKGRDYINFTHPEDRDIQMRNIQNSFTLAGQQNERLFSPDGTRSNPDLNPQEFRIIRSDGSICWVEGDAVAVVDDEGKPIRMLGVLVDITERKLTEERIHQLNAELEKRVVERTAQLEEANQELEAFSYSVSHDLRAPLRAINGFSHVLAEEGTALLNENHQRYLQLIRENVLRMNQLIDDLLSFSRLGRQPFHKHQVDIAALAREVLDELRSEFHEREIDLKIANLPPCEADSSLLRQVFVNLFDNALKYSRTREVVQIEVGWQQQGIDTVYFVRDNGVGFDMVYADKLFGVFQRLHRQDEFEGTGVGLATVQRILHRHGGHIWAEAEVNKGATFYFTLHSTGK